MECGDIGILELAPYRDPGRDAGHLDAERRDEPRQVQRGRVPFDVRARRDDDLFDFQIFVALKACQKRVDPKVGWADPSKWIEDTMKDMVDAPKYAAPFERDAILGLRHDAYDAPIAARIAASLADLDRGQVAADPTKPQDVLQGADRLGKFAHEVWFSLHDRQRESER